MMALTRKADYALVALAHLAKRPSVVCSAREIADRYHMPHPVLMNILKKLTREGVVSSVRGAAGGYVLAHPAAKLSVERIIEAIEGPIRFVHCADDNDTDCDVQPWCPIQAPARKLHQSLKDFLAGVSLADLIETSDDMETEDVQPVRIGFATSARKSADAVQDDSRIESAGAIAVASADRCACQTEDNENPGSTRS